MIPSDGALLAFLAVAAVVHLLFVVLLWRELVGGRSDARAARRRDLELLERIAPSRPVERKRVVGLIPPADDGPPRGSAAEVVHYPEGSEDAEGTVREVAGG
jgi:hypothetical protein